MGKKSDKNNKKMHVLDIIEFILFFFSDFGLNIPAGDG